MNSKEYWEKREAANLVSNLKKEKAYERELERIYRDMLDGVQKEIESFYARYADKEGISIAEARKAVSQLDIEAYERKAKRYVKDKDMSKIANEEMRLYNLTMKVNRLEMLKANIGLELIKGHAELEKFMGDILQGRTEEELRRQAGILGKTIRNNAQLANSIVNASYHNATFSQRVWMYHGQMKADLGKMLENGLIQGKGVRQLTKELRKYYIGEPTLKNGRDGAEFAAERLMRTELARVQTDAQKQSFEKNGFGQYKFIVNSGCCAKCKAVAEKNDGVYDVADMMPGTNAPPMHPFCRCSTAAYEDSDEYEAWLDYLDKGGTTEQWNDFKNNAKYRKLKNDEDIFVTMDGRTPGKGRDVIKPRNIMKALRKSEIGAEMLRYLEDNKIPVLIWYGVDVEEDKAGAYVDGEIHVYGDNTKTIAESALTVIHETTHAKINKPNTKTQELQCYINEYKHKGIELTDNVIEDIMAYIDEEYDYLEWE